MAAKRITYIVGSIVLISSTAFAQLQAPVANLEARFFQELVSDNLTQDKSLLQKITEDIPDGLSTKDISPACDPRRFEDSLVDVKHSTREYFQIVNNYFKRCGSELSKNSWKGLLSLLKFSMYKYDFLSHPEIRNITIPLRNGVRVPGILALKDDTTPRPLVIVRCGVFCAAEQDSPSLRSYIMHLFDQSPFNLLILANQTGLDYISLNRYFTMGGWAEGYESLEVGRWMRETWEHRNRISSMHFMGISLGGNAAVMGSRFNDEYRLKSGTKVFSSVTAICPVMNLRPTLSSLYGSQVVGRIFMGMTKSQLSEARHYVLDIPDLISDILPRRKEMVSYIGEMASTSLERRGLASTPNEFYRNNNFFNVADGVATPLMIWASKDDMVVDNSVNAAAMGGQTDNTGVVNLNYGNHCAFNAAYGHAAAAAVLRTFVLQNSPEFLPKYIKKKMNLKVDYKRMSRAQQHVGQIWKFDKGSSQVRLKFRYFDWGPEQCFDKGPWAGEATCLTTREYKVPIDALKEMGARIPASIAEAEALSREFNTKVELRTKNGPLTGTSAYNGDFFLQWRAGF